MKKLLHERLREHAKQETLTVTGNHYSVALFPHEANAIADEIERYYIPRPRFEDGEPLQWGEIVDEYEKPIDGIKLFNDGSGSVGNHSDDVLRWVRFNNVKKASLKRPSPKVLDADGVEIKVGDIIFDENGETHVVEVIHENLYITTSLLRFVNPEDFTHKEPDTREKIKKELAINLHLQNMASYPITIDDCMEISEQFISRIEALEQQ